MTQILHLDSSPRAERSHSRQLTRAFVEQLTQQHPDATVVYRDLGHNPVPHVDEPWIAAAFSDPASHSPENKAAIALSDSLVAELFASDILVIGAPMYNLSIPSTLKAYIDQIVRVGVTFTLDYQGLVTGKKAFIFCARGASGYGVGEPMEQANFQDPYFKAIFGLIGITDITFLHDEKTTFSDSQLDENLKKLRELAQGVTA